MATSINVDDICTDADLANEVGGAPQLDRINRDVSQRDKFRAQALDDVIAALSSRSPPVSFEDLSIPSELRTAVCYRALSKLYVREITAAGDRNHVLSKDFQESYLAAMRAGFTMSQGQTSPPGGSFSFERR